MRKAQLKIEPVKGDEEGADLIVFVFPGGAGSVDANVQRWQSTFKDKDGKPPKVDVKTVKGQNVEATRVEIAGHYYPTAFPGQPKQPDHDNYRLLGAIVLTDANSFLPTPRRPRQDRHRRPARLRQAHQLVQSERQVIQRDPQDLLHRSFLT